MTVYRINGRGNCLCRDPSVLPVAMALFLLCLSTATSSIPLRTPKDLARGFGDHIKWQTLQDGIQTAQSEQKPILLLIHQEECPACKDLAPRFAADVNIAEWSQYFAMVNCKDEEEPRNRMFAPDGNYFPRILFLSPKGQILYQIKNEQGHPKYMYYYFTPESVFDSMMKVIKLFYEVEYEDAEDL